MLKVIGLVGFKGSGKSTTFDILKNLNANVEEIMIANHLKNVCSVVFHIPRTHFDDQNFKEKEFKNPIVLSSSVIEEVFRQFYINKDQYSYDTNIKPHVGVILMSPRQIAQYVGTELLRSVDPDIHVKTAIKNMRFTDKVYVVTDIRFFNEFNTFNNDPNVSFVSLYIKRDSQTPKDISSVHASEREIPLIGEKCLATVSNNTTVSDFRARLLKTLAKVSQG